MDVVEEFGHGEARNLQMDLDEFQDHIHDELTRYQARRDQLVADVFPDKAEVEDLLREEVSRRKETMKRLAARITREGDSILSSKAFLALISTPAPDNSLCRDLQQEELLALRSLRRRLGDSTNVTRRSQCAYAYDAAVRVRSLSRAHDTLKTQSTVWRHARWHAASCGAEQWTELPVAARDQVETAGNEEFDGFRLKIEAISELVRFTQERPEKAHKLLTAIGSGGQKEVYLAAAELARMKYEDPYGAFIKDMRKRFEQTYGRPVPKDLTEWTAFVENADAEDDSDGVRSDVMENGMD